MGGAGSRPGRRMRRESELCPCPSAAAGVCWSSELPASSAAFLYKVPSVTAAVGETLPRPSQGQRRALSWSEIPGSTGQTGEDALKGCAQFGAPWGGFGV